MSVLIKGVKIPQSCYDCDMLEVSSVVGCEHAYDTKNSEWGRALNCPLIELPDHGDLIDRDALSREMYHEAFETDSALQKWDSGCWIRYEMFEKHRDAAPVVIPAERKNVEVK